MFMNSNALPIALMQSLVVSVPDLMWGSDDNKDAMLGRALTYLTMYSTLGMVVRTLVFLFRRRKTVNTFSQLRYSYGVQLLSNTDTILNRSEGSVEECTPLLEDSPIRRSLPSSSTLVNGIAGYDEPTPIRPFKLNGTLLPPLGQNTAFYNSFPNSPNDSRPVLPIYESESESEDNETLSTHIRPKHCLHHFWHHIVRAAIVLNTFMTVPLWASLLSLLVACIEPLKHALLNHLHPLNNAIANAGKCSVPLTLVILGAYFHVPDETSPRTFMQYMRDMRHVFCHKQPPQETQVEPKPGETKAVFLAVTSRMIITPVLLIPGMALAIKYDWHEVFLE